MRVPSIDASNPAAINNLSSLAPRALSALPDVLPTEDLDKVPKSVTSHKIKPFDFEFIKIMLSDKNSKDKEEVEEVLLKRSWIEKSNAIPHFSKVI